MGGGAGLMTYEEQRELAERLGILWHERIYINEKPLCKCGYNDGAVNLCLHLANTHYPDFTTPDGIVLLIREMMKRKGWNQFRNKVGCTLEGKSYVHTSYITDTTGKLAMACLEWLRRKGK
jgi:hypothetical protein